VTLTIRGEIDMASGATLARELYRAERPLLRRIVLDLAALDFIDSTGIHVLLHAQERVASNGHLLVLTNVPANTQRLFSLAGLDGHLVIQ
jgi:anti-anti-sigma factor